MNRKQIAISLLFGAVIVGFLGILTIYSTSLKDSATSAGVNSTFSGYELDLSLAYNFASTTNEGEPIALQDFRDSIVLLDFWSSWCAPCKKEAKLLNDLYLEYSSTGAKVQFIGVNIWDTQEDFINHLEAYGIKYPNVLDDTGSVLFEYGVRGIPEKYLIDPQGRLIWKFVGPTERIEIEEKINLFLGHN